MLHIPDLREYLRAEIERQTAERRDYARRIAAGQMARSERSGIVLSLTNSLTLTVTDEPGSDSTLMAQRTQRRASFSSSSNCCSRSGDEMNPNRV